MKKRTTLLSLAAVLCAAVLSGSGAFAQSYPTKPVKTANVKAE